MSYSFYNIKRHNYIRFSSIFPDAHEYTPREMYYKIYISLKIMVAYILNIIRGKKQQPLEQVINEVLILEGTSNQKKSLSPVYNNLNISTYTIIGQKGFGEYLPWQEVNTYTCIYILTFLFNYWLSTKEEKVVIRSYFNDFFYTIGTTAMAEKIIKRNRIRLVIMANDHSMVFRAFKEAADRCHVPTMYLQHASVTERFPSLQFSYSFLDGMDSFKKYHSVGKIKGEIFLSGSPRFDIISRCPKQQLSYFVVGIAINLLDDEFEVKKLCLFLQKEGYDHIVVRPHPGTHIVKDWYLEHNIQISDSNSELSFEFLSKISLMISGESSIHLDAALMNVKSICYAFNKSESIKDWYSYQKHGLYPYVDNFDSLIQELRNIVPKGKNVESKVLYYNASYGLPINGCIGEMIADFIRKYLDGDVDQFKRKYELVEVKPDVWCYSNYRNYFLEHLT